MDTPIEIQQQTPTRALKDYAGLVAKGFAMGASDVVPGVSGGTMAFILGIYEELINSIRSLINVQAVKLLLQFKIKEALAILPWKFLEWMLINHPALLWSFFFGLVLSSILTVSKRVSAWGATTIAATIIGTIAAYIIVGLVPVQTPEEAWFLFLSGAIAICAMILPGISGSFILVLLGKYQFVLSAVNQRDFVPLLIVAVGAAVGIVTFAQILGWLFKRYHDVTVAILIGLMLGSLRKIWPWKETVSYILDRHGAEIPTVQNNILPPVWTSEVTYALILAIIGFGVVFMLDYWAGSEKK